MTQLSLIDEVHAKPFIKWVGGKRRLAKTIARYIPQSIKTYYEPFLGGGAVFFYLAPRIERAVLSDKNTELMTTYEVVRDKPEALISMLKVMADEYRQNTDLFYTVKDQQHLKNPVAIAARMVFLNKTCFNGIYRVNAEGQFTGSKGEETRTKDGYAGLICQPERILNASKVLQKATLINGDYDEVVKPVEGDFIYADPPYDGTFAKYQATGFNQDEQVRLRDTADKWRKTGANVMLSNSLTDNIQALYNDYRLEKLSISYGINPVAQKTNGRSEEALLMSYPEEG